MSTLSSRLAQIRTVVQQETKVWAPETVEDIRLRLSLKVSMKGNLVFLVMNLETLSSKEYSYMMLITLKKITVQSVKPANIPHVCLCQALLGDSENELLTIRDIKVN